MNSDKLILRKQAAGLVNLAHLLRYRMYDLPQLFSTEEEKIWLEFKENYYISTLVRAQESYIPEDISYIEEQENNKANPLDDTFLEALNMF